RWGQNVGIYFVGYTFQNLGPDGQPSSYRINETTVTSGGGYYYGQADLACYNDGEIITAWTVEGFFTIDHWDNQGKHLAGHFSSSVVVGQMGAGGLACQRNAPGNWVIAGGMPGPTGFNYLQYQIATGDSLGGLVQLGGLGAAYGAGVDNNGRIILAWWES